MRHYLVPAIVAGALLASPRTGAADKGYFSKGEKSLVFQEEGERSKTEIITLIALAGTAVVAGGVGGLFMLDAQSKSDEVSASGQHTLKVWSADLEDTRKGALRSSKIGTVALGVGGAFLGATIVAFIITQPDSTTGYQDWQTLRRMPSVTPTRGGALVTRGWSF